MSRRDPRLITAPAYLPVTLAEVKTHLGVDHAYKDDQINRLIRSRVAAIDGYGKTLSRCIMPQIWQVELAAFPACDGGNIVLRPGSVVGIDSIKYTDGSGVEQTINPANYKLFPSGDQTDAYVRPAYGLSWPVARYEPDAVRVRFVSGYAAATANEAAQRAAVPEDLRAAIILAIESDYDGKTMPERTIDALLEPFRRVAV